MAENIAAPRNYDMVIARYKEPLNWLYEVDLSKINRIFIYNKSAHSVLLDQNRFDKRIQITITNLPNVGRESHTYLYHLINNYCNISDRIIFTQAKFDDHTKFENFFLENNFYSLNYDDLLKKFRFLNS